jgi:hypothetical protein
VIAVGQTRAVPEIASSGRMTKPLRVSDDTVSGDAVALIGLIFRDQRDDRFGPLVAASSGRWRRGGTARGALARRRGHCCNPDPYRAAPTLSIMLAGARWDGTRLPTGHCLQAKLDALILSEMFNLHLSFGGALSDLESQRNNARIIN